MERGGPGRSASTRAKTELERARDIRLGPVGAAAAGAFIGWASIFAKATLAEAIQGDPGYIVLMAAVITAAWFGGFIGGFVAAGATFVLNVTIFLNPLDMSLASDRVEVWRQLVFVVVALATVALIGSRRASIRSSRSCEWRAARARRDGD